MNNKLNEFRKNKSSDLRRRRKRTKNVHQQFSERCYDFSVK